MYKQNVFQGGLQTWHHLLLCNHFKEGWTRVSGTPKAGEEHDGTASPLPGGRARDVLRRNALRTPAQLVSATAPRSHMARAANYIVATTLLVHLLDEASALTQSRLES